MIKRQVSSDTEQVGFLEYESWRWVIANITGQRHGNVNAEGFATTFLSSMESVESQLESSSEDLPGYITSMRMRRSLHNVAQLINSTVPVVHSGSSSTWKRGGGTCTAT